MINNKYVLIGEWITRELPTAYFSIYTHSNFQLLWVVATAVLYKQNLIGDLNSGPWVVSRADLYKQNLIGDLHSGPWVENELKPIKPMVKQEYNWLKILFIALATPLHVI